MIVPLTPVRFLHRAMDLYPRKTGVVAGEKRFTYAAFGERCERLAAGLVESGVEPGDRVGFLSYNTHQLLEGYYAAPLARAIIMPLNVRLTASELSTILAHAEPSILFFEAEFADVIDTLRAAAPECRFVNIDSGEYEELLGRSRGLRADIFAFDENAPAELFYTSGSTGAPKGVVLSHRTLYLHAMSVAGEFSNDDNRVELHTIPLFHANGWGRPQTAVMKGLKQVMVRRFDPALIFRLIQDEGATTMSLVPTMAAALLMAPGRDQFDLSAMKQIHIGGAAASPELIERMEQAFRCEVIAGYGLTETSPVITSARCKGTVKYQDANDRCHRQAMAGWPLPGVDVRVVDLQLNDVPRDMRSIGEVVVRGDHVMDGYYKDERGTAAVMSGPWLHTGDMAVWDEENYIHIVDRRKDIIISGGENISSLEVEKALAAHPAVLECAVVSAPDVKWGEVPAAFVVVKPGESVTCEELAGFLETRLAKFKIPRRFDLQVEPLPKTGTGKIFKRQLRERFWEGRERRVQG
jgi:fatty-acyl-CoA synthase